MPDSYTVEIISGNIFDATEKYLCHQTNCVTNRAAHLAKDVFRKYPWADIYTPRQTPDVPGTIIVKGNGQDQRYVINMLGQYYPGYPKYPNSTKDGGAVRQKYFHQCLHQISKLPDLESLAFPFKIGCGAAGGDWTAYLDLIQRFTAFVNKSQPTRVVIYQLGSDE